ncbi:MAG: IPT/TIG domain-containing protein [Planctomycetota bacterium]
MLRPSILILALATFLSPSRAQNTFSYPDFSSTAGLVMNGSATPSGSAPTLVMTSGPSEAASVYRTSLVTVEGGFDTTFTYRILPLTPFADPGEGFAFIVQNAVAATAALGYAGDSLGYGGLIENALVIEFDNELTAANGDATDNEISIRSSNGPPLNVGEGTAIARTSPAVDLDDGAAHTVRIRQAFGELSVFVDDLVNPVLSLAWDFESGGTALTNPGLPPMLLGHEAWVGFTAGTSGARSQRLEILDWNWSSTDQPAACFASRVGLGLPGAPFDILTINGATGGFLRRLQTEIYQPWTVSLASSPANPLPAKLAIIGFIGTPGPADFYPTPWGDLCFAPGFVQPVPWRFTLVDSLTSSPSALLPPTLTPFSLTLPWLAQPLSLTLQGAVLEDNSDPLSVALTNAVILDFLPVDPPTITSVTPAVPPPGANVMLQGTGFNPAMTLLIDGNPVPINVLTSVYATFTAPALIACDTTLTVLNPDQSGDSILINETPTIDFFPFSTGPASGGSIFAIGGTSLANPASVHFGLTPALVTNSSPTLITGIIPPGPAMTSVLVTVTPPLGCRVTTTYTYQ